MMVMSGIIEFRSGHRAEREAKSPFHEHEAVLQERGRMVRSLVAEVAGGRPDGGDRVVELGAYQLVASLATLDEHHAVLQESRRVVVSPLVEAAGKLPFPGGGGAGSRREESKEEDQG